MINRSKTLQRLTESGSAVDRNQVKNMTTPTKTKKVGNEVTDSYLVTTKGGTYEIDLYHKEGKLPMGYQMTKKDDKDYFNTGCLEMVEEAGHQIVEGYDGTYTLPLPLAKLLASLGYAFGGYVFPYDNL
jgi:hypothetical protein